MSECDWEAPLPDTGRGRADTARVIPPLPERVSGIDRANNWAINGMIGGLRILHWHQQAGREGHKDLGGIRPLKVSEIGIAAGILERSFFDDPGIVNILPKVSDRVRLGKTLASAMVRFTLSCGIVVIDDSHRGVALWFPPDSAAPTQDVLRQSGMLDVPALIGDEAWLKIKALMAELDPLHGLRAKEPHWYLSMIGVEPELQRRGVGDSLLRSTLDLVDAQGLSAYLLTPIAELIGFYGRHGFAVAADARVLDGNLHMRLMRREAARSPRREA